MARYFPPAADRVALTTLLIVMQTFLLPDVLEDLRSPANLRYRARSLLTKMDKRGIGTLSFVRASSEPVMDSALLHEVKFGFLPYLRDPISP